MLQCPPSSWRFSQIDVSTITRDARLLLLIFSRLGRYLKYKHQKMRFRKRSFWNLLPASMRRHRTTGSDRGGFDFKSIPKSSVR
jgi:hypothetical protein